MYTVKMKSHEFTMTSSIESKSISGPDINHIFLDRMLRQETLEVNVSNRVFDR